MSLLQTIWASTGILLLFTVLLIAGATDQDIESHETALYCEMVAIHKADQTLGWPDYKRTYNEVCK
jgi:hypothetical protein